MLTPEEQSLRVVALRGQVLANHAITEGMSGTVRRVRQSVNDRGRRGLRYEVLWDFGVRVSPPDPVDEAPELVTPKILVGDVVRSIYQVDVSPDDIALQQTDSRGATRGPRR